MTTYTYTIETSDDDVACAEPSKIWVPETTGTEQDDSTPVQYARDVIYAYLDERERSVDYDVKVIVWEGTTSDTESMASAVVYAPGGGRAE